MKKFARLMSTVIAVVLIITLFASCDKKSIYDKYVAASTKTDSLEHLYATLEMKMDYKAEGMTLNMPVTANIKSIKNDGKLSKMTMDMDMSIMGQKVETKMYYADGYMYMDMGSLGMKVKQAYPFTEVEKTASAIKPPELNEEILKNATYSEKDGITTIDVTFDGKILLEQLSSLFNNYMSQLGMEDEDSMEDRTLSDVKATLIIDKNGYLSYTSMLFDITTVIPDLALGITGESEETSEGTSVNLSMDMKITYKNIGEPVTINAPDDIDEYVEYDEDDYLGGLTGDDSQYDEDYSTIYGELVGLYDENYNLIEGYEEKLNELYETYGQETVDAVYADVQSLIEEMVAE